MALGVVEHFQHHAEFDAVRMRFDFTRLRRQLVNGPRIFFGIALGRVVRELDVRIGDRRLLQIFVDRTSSFLIAAFDFQRYLGAATASPASANQRSNCRSGSASRSLRRSSITR